MSLAGMLAIDYFKGGGVSAIETLRDALFGNPPSPTHEPSREGVLAAFRELNDDLGQLLSINAIADDIYETTAAGIAATVDGDLFLVKGDGDPAFADLYKNVAETAVYQDVSLPSTAQVALAATQAQTDGATQVALAKAAAIQSNNSALATAAYGAIPLEQSNYTMRLLAENMITRPAVVLSENGEAWGDSQNVVGSPTGTSITAQFNAMATGGFAITDNSVGGTTSTQALAAFTAASATVKGHHQMLLTGTNDMDTLVGNRRDWAKSGFTKANVAAFKSLITGGKQLCIILPLRKDSALPGQQQGADYTYYARDMIATYGADAVDSSRTLRTKGETSGPDYYNVKTNDGAPLSFLGSSANVGFGINSAPFFIVAGAPADIAYDDGQYAWDSTNLRWYRKQGATGTGSWVIADVKHFSAYAKAVAASDLRDWWLAMTGQGAPFAPPQSFRCAFDLAAGGLVGTVAIRTATSAFGSVAKAEIIAGNEGGVFSVDPFGRVRRSNSGVMQRKVYLLFVRLTGSNGYKSLGIVEIFVGRASTQTLPQKILIPSPVSLYGMEGHGLSSAGKVISGAVWMNCSNLSTSPYLINWVVGANGSQAKMFLQLAVDANSGTGKFRYLLYSAANTVIANINSRSQFNGGVGIPGNTWGWLTWSIDLAAGTVIAYWNDTALSFTSPGVATFVNETIPLADMSPLFLGARSIRGVDPTGAFSFKGGVGYGALWTSAIDWTDSARRRELFNVDGTAAITNSTGTINGVAADMVWFQGEPVDLAWGGLNPGQIVQCNQAALSTMSIAP